MQVNLQGIPLEVEIEVGFFSKKNNHSHFRGHVTSIDNR